MQARKAARVLPDPVGAEIKVVRPARICGQPCSCGSVGGPNLLTNPSATSGCAQERDCIALLYQELSLHIRPYRPTCLPHRWLIPFAFPALLCETGITFSINRMGRIHVLPEHFAKKNPAGEIVEPPPPVLKE